MLARVWLCALAGCLLSPRGADAKIVAGVVIPHGDFCYDPSLVKGKNGSTELNAAAQEAGAWLSETVKPDLVLLSTPHGLELENDWVFYENEDLVGSAPLGQDLHNASNPGYEVKMKIKTDVDETQAMIKALGTNVTGIKGFGGGMSLPISWGEIIPMSFFSEGLRQGMVVMGQPLRRYDHSKEMVPDLLTLGEHIFEHFEKSDKRVAVVISSDLAHTHQADGPYGFSPNAEPYDVAVRKWAADMDRQALIHKAADLQDGAKSCGFTGLVMLQGVMDAAAKKQHPRAAWESRMLANFHPTYYGMMIATFERTAY